MNLQELYKSYGRNKTIPEKYAFEILTALSHYPELADTRITFVLANHAFVPYGSRPTAMSCFKSQQKRIYKITIREQAPYPVSEVLFKKLSFSMKVSVIGHELAHVKQYSACGFTQLFKLFMGFALKKSRRILERSADLIAIEHGFGKGLLSHTLYIRSIPGYVEMRPAINTNYLAPEEIKKLMS